MPIDVKKSIEALLVKQKTDYTICGVVTKEGVVFPLGTDTKVLSTIFELLTRPLVHELAKAAGLQVYEPTVQNHYPDFTLANDVAAKNKIAIDVKTTYIINDDDSFGFTLGGYTSFLRGAGTKNIHYPYSDYGSHWVIGYVYKRIATKKSADYRLHTVNDLATIALPYESVRVFVQEKWKIASDRAGSGNTTNIGSIYGKFADFQKGNTPFRCEEEYLEYWRNYARTKVERLGSFSTVAGFRAWKKLNKR